MAVPTALSTLSWSATGVGSPGAPASGGDDETNCLWCQEKGAILVTHDRGKTDREILKTLDQLQVGVILVLRDLRPLPAYRLALALLQSVGSLEKILKGPHQVRHQLRKTGNLVRPG